MRRPPPMSCPNYAESAPVRFSPELQLDLTCRSWCGLGKVKTSRGLTAAILEAAYGFLTLFSSVLKVMPECNRSQNFSSPCLTGRGHKNWWGVKFSDFPFFPLLNLSLIFRHFYGQFTALWQNSAAVPRRTDVSQRDQVTALSLSLNRRAVPKQKLLI